MTMRDTTALLVAALALVAPVAAPAAEAPAAVSPGSAAATVIEGRCPTFLWGAVPGARAYELVVYRAEEEAGAEAPLWRQELPGSASVWTPPLDRCLERGDRYAWSLRALGGEAESDWSAPSLFQVAPAPSAAELERALDVLRRHLGAGPAGGGAGIPVVGAPPSPVKEAGPAATLQTSLSSGEALQVDGSPVVLRPHLCGTGSVEPWETCDDGNDENDDCCTNDCAVALVVSVGGIGDGMNLTPTKNRVEEGGEGFTVGGQVDSPNVFWSGTESPTFSGTLTTLVQWALPGDPITETPATPTNGAVHGDDNWMKVIRASDGAVFWTQFVFDFLGTAPLAFIWTGTPQWVTRTDGSDFPLSLAVAAEGLMCPPPEGT